jgi:uncharacterized hydrophobic protein (TIGR00271 family)
VFGKLRVGADGTGFLQGKLQTASIGCPAMVHLRVVAPAAQAEQALELLLDNPVACHVVRLEGVVKEPEGDMILADVPREDASVIVGDLKALGIPEVGSISIEPIEVQLSKLADEAEKAAPGDPADAVVWEEVEARTSEQSRLTWSFVTFMILAGLLASVGIYLDSPILVVGAMVVGPEFGPIAGFCVAVVERRPRFAVRSFVALAVGFPAAITAVVLASLAFRATGVTPDTFTAADHGLSTSIASPDFFAFFVAFCAGTAGMLSLSTAKSGALIGVLISVTTIPAAANIGVAFTYADWESWRGSQQQLAINVAALLVAGTLTLWIQRLSYTDRRHKHLRSGEGVSAKSPGTTTPRASSASAEPRHR